MNRRFFINSVALGGATLSLSPDWEGILAKPKMQNTVKIALIGKGGMGTADANTALRTPGVELIAVCDVFQSRLDLAKKEWGEHIRTEMDYRNILKMSDVDAVIIGTPDHWHQKIAIDALKSGKHVYCEKPIIHKRSEGKALINAQQSSGKVFQMGTQGVSAVGMTMAKQLIENGAIGKINFVDARFSGAPSMLNSFQAPKDATPDTIWWSQFVGKAAKKPFDAQRFFNWRNWSDYGTGLAGDLFVHVIASVHYITGVSQPKRVYSDGDIVYYTDGSRDTPDVVFSLVDYEDKIKQQHFKMFLGANMVDGVSKDWGSVNFKIVGEKGTLQVNWDKVSLKFLHDQDWTTYENMLRQIAGFDKIERINDKEIQFLAKTGHPDAHYLHFQRFFDAIRTGSPVVADVTFGVNASSVALRCFESQQANKIV